MQKSILFILLLVILIVIVVIAFCCRSKKEDPKRKHRHEKTLKSSSKSLQRQRRGSCSSSSSSSSDEEKRPRNRWIRCRDRRTGKTTQVDALNDSNNCGNCGNVCPPGQICRNGKCRCPNSTDLYCNGVCINVTVDTSNCGRCGRNCKPHLSCVNGKCRCADPATKNCGSYCANLNTDAKNCGECGKQCPPSYVCKDGVCVCPNSSDVLCNGLCTDLINDSLNCGQCGQQCASHLICQNSSCQCTNTTATNCGTYCAELKTDVNNCGQCGQQCAQHLICESGNCQCASATATNCGTYCAELQTDVRNCGQCGQQCAQHLICESGNCQCASATATNCGTYCAELQTDIRNCGQCGIQCPAGSICVQGACVCVTNDNQPDPNSTACPSGCTNTQVDPNNCGACGIVCDQKSGQECKNGQCVGPTPPQQMTRIIQHDERDSKGTIVGKKSIISFDDGKTWEQKNLLDSYVFQPQWASPSFNGVFTGSTDTNYNLSVGNTKITMDGLRTSPNNNPIPVISINSSFGSADNGPWYVRAIPTYVNTVEAPTMRYSATSGTIYLSYRPASAPTTYNCTLAQSSDQGQTWSTLVTKSTPSNNSFPPSGALFHVDDSNLQQPKIIYHYYPLSVTGVTPYSYRREVSLDDGKTWSSPQIMFEEKTVLLSTILPSQMNWSVFPTRILFVSSDDQKCQTLFSFDMRRTVSYSQRNTNNTLSTLSSNRTGLFVFMQTFDNHVSWTEPKMVDLDALLFVSGWIQFDTTLYEPYQFYTTIRINSSATLNNVAVSNDGNVMCIQFRCGINFSTALSVGALNPNATGTHECLALTLNAGQTWSIYSLTLGGKIDGLLLTARELIIGVYINKDNQVFFVTTEGSGVSTPYYRVYQYDVATDRFILLNGNALNAFTNTNIRTFKRVL